MCEHETYLTEELQKRDQLLQRFYALNWAYHQALPLDRRIAEKIEGAIITIQDFLVAAFNQEHLIFHKQHEKPEKQNQDKGEKP